MNQDRIERSSQLAYKGGYKYQLQQPYWIQTPLRPEKYVSNEWIGLDTDGKMLFMPGYAWDGPSGPMPDMQCTMAGSLMHDGGYQLIREGLLPSSEKDKLDRFLKEMLLADGSGWIIAEIVY